MKEKLLALKKEMMRDGASTRYIDQINDMIRQAEAEEARFKSMEIKVMTGEDFVGEPLEVGGGIQITDSVINVYGDIPPWLRG